LYTTARLPPFQQEIPERGSDSKRGPADQEPDWRRLVEPGEEQDASAEQHYAERP
jgi:hypothetical protein